MIDRTKFKKTSASQLVQADKDLNKTLGKKDKPSNGHDLDEGSNLLRFYPVHPSISEEDDTAQFCEPFVQQFLPAMVWAKDDKGQFIYEDAANTKHKLTLSVRTVYNSKIHGGTPKDLLEEYILLAGRIARDKFKADSDRKQYLEPIYGNFAKKINGINYAPKWVAYADKYPNGNPDATPVFDKFFFKKSIKERLNIIAQMESKNDPLGTDPFTDLEDGRAVSIFMNKEGGAQHYYTTELDNNTTTEVLQNGRTAKVPLQYPLSDKQLEHFLAQTPLRTLYGNVAKRKNFEAQLSGLEMFDEKNKMGIFGLDEWSDIVMECDSYYPEEDETVDPMEPGNHENTEDIVSESIVEDNTDEFDLMNRTELQLFSKENKTGILVKPGLSDDDIRAKLRTWQAGVVEIPHVPLPGEDGYEEPILDKVEPAKVDTQEEKDAFLRDLKGEPAPAQDPKDRLAAMRAKMAKK